MEMNIIVRLVFVLAITILLLAKNDNRQIGYFSQQTWTIKEIMPVFLFFVIISLVGLWLSQKIPPGRLHIIFSCILTLLAGSILFVFAKIVLNRIKSSADVFGFKTSDIFWYLFFILIQYGILIIYFFSGHNHKGILWVLIYTSITLIFWPVIEETFYLGMMLIPSSRKVGLKIGIVLVSLLKMLIHFNHNLPALAIDFVLGLFSGYLYIKSERILVPILLHSSLNLFVLVREFKSLLP